MKYIYCTSQDCDNFVENQETGLCASCARLERKKQEKKSKPKKFYKIPLVSKKKKQANKRKKQAYLKMDDTKPKYCSGCGSSQYPISHSHIIPVGQHPEFEAVPENIVYDCMTIGNHVGCHDVWEHGNISQKMNLINFHERIDVIKKLSMDYYHRVFTLKS